MSCAEKALEVKILDYENHIFFRKSKMPSNDKSTHLKGMLGTRKIARTKVKSNLEDESLLLDKSLMPWSETEMALPPSLEQVFSQLDLLEYYSEAKSDKTNSIYPSATEYLREQRWRQQNLILFYEMNGFDAENHTFDEPEYEFEEYLDWEDDNENDFSDGIDDSIRITKSRFRKKNYPSTVEKVIHDDSAAYESQNDASEI
jgi:hypothetical protein